MADKPKEVDLHAEQEKIRRLLAATKKRWNPVHAEVRRIELLIAKAPRAD